MLANLLRSFLLCELIAYVALGYALQPIPPLQVGCLIVSIAVAWRVILTGMICLLSRMVTPSGAAQSLGVAAGLKYFLQELVSLAYAYGWAQPFPSRPGIPVAPDSGGQQTPIVLVHGIYCNRGIWHSMQRFLRDRGLGPVVALDLVPLFGSMDTQAANLSNALDRICSAYDASTVVIVAHSMGGLVARRMLQTCSRPQVVRLVTIASPHHGSEMARFALGRAAPQLLPSSGWLTALNAPSPHSSPTPILSIYSQHDELVVPASSAHLSSARNIALAGIGHVALLSSPTVQAALASELQAVLGETAMKPPRISNIAGPLG